MLQKNQYKLLFSSIIKGYSEFKSNQFGNLFIKHFSNFDLAEIETQNDLIFQRAKSSGLPTIEEKEKSILQEGLWTIEKDVEIKELPAFISNLRLTKQKLFRQYDLDQINIQIKEHQDKLDKLIQSKNNLIGLTAESYANKRINEFYIRNTFFKDSGFKLALFDEEQFDELSAEDLTKLVLIYNDCTKEFNEGNFKKIALAPFFSSIYYLCDDNPLTFYGKPVIHLTFYQAEVFSYGRYFKNLMSGSESRPPVEIMDNPEAIIEFYSSSDNVKKVMDKTENSDGASLVGATKSDLAKLGVDTSGSDKILKEAKKHGGLNFQQLIALHN